ncbi:hypothetical protein J6590_050016 [Homalodisca vitripennis]|nr:hypothetical protein J6590_050016 [Homalodisca vitripennis]
MRDLRTMLPHSRDENKMERGENFLAVNETRMQPPPSLMFSVNPFQDSPKGFTPRHATKLLRSHHAGR